MSYKINKAKYVEFGATTSGQQQYYFPDLNDIRNANVWGIETYSVSQVTKTYAGNDPLAVADLANAYLVLYFKGGNFIQVPLIKAITTKNNATTGVSGYSEYPMNLLGQVITWTKSYVWFGTTSGLTTGRYFTFNVYYTDPA